MTTKDWVLAILPIVTLLIGAVGAYLADARRDLRALEREEEAHRRHELAKADAFQRDTLLALQETITDLARSTARIQTLAMIDEREGRVYGRGRLPADLSEGDRQTRATLTKLRVRVRDEQVRAMASDFASLTGDVSLAENLSAADSASAAAGELYDRLNEHIGRLMRGEA